MVFDIDGTLLDSAPGIVAGFQHALRSVGFEPPDEERLRGDLGPPVGKLFTSLGVSDEVLAEAVAAYRSYYFARGLQEAVPYPGVVEVLEQLREARVPLGTATAKRTDIANAILTHHGLDHYFAVINGTDDQRTTKAGTLAHTLQRLESPNPANAYMVGDRHSDVAGAQECGVVSVGVTWGYGSLDELSATGADHLIERPAQLLDIVFR